MATETVINTAALAALIDKDGTTPTALARRAHISKQHMSDLLMGKRRASAPVRKALADALRVPVSAIETLCEVA